MIRPTKDQHSIYRRALQRLVAGLLIVTTTLPITNATEDTAYYRLAGSINANYDVSVKDTEIAFRLLFDELLVEINERLNMKVYQDVDQLWADLQAEKIDGIYATTLEMLDHLNEVRDQPLLAFSVNDTPFVRYQLIVKRDSPYQSLADLRGKRVALSHHINIGSMFLDVELMTQGLPRHQEFFAEINREESTHTAAVSLFFGKVDAALVAETSFNVAARLNPQLKEQTKILTQSAELIPSFTSVRIGFPEDRVRQLTQVATTMHTKPRGKHLLKMFGTEAIIPIDRDSLTSVRELRNTYRKLLRQQ